MKVIFWNVDTQKDFMNKDGKLYVKDAEEIKPVLKRLTQLAMKCNIKVVSTGDLHTESSKEISSTPDFVNTFPPHCMQSEEGSSFIKETDPNQFREWTVFRCDHEDLYDSSEIGDHRNIVIFKDVFDVFKGNKHTDEIVKLLNPDLVIVYGVATNVCVNYAVIGLLERDIEVMVISDAIKELPVIPENEIYENWLNKGAKIVDSAYIEDLLKRD